MARLLNSNREPPMFTKGSLLKWEYRRYSWGRGSTPTGSHFGGFRCTTHFSRDFCGDWEVNWGLTGGFGPIAMFACYLFQAGHAHLGAAAAGAPESAGPGGRGAAPPRRKTTRERHPLPSGGRGSAPVPWRSVPWKRLFALRHSRFFGSGAGRC